MACVNCWPSDPAWPVADAFGRWQASLALAYASRDGRTVPTLRRHQGPLRVQKHFHPEGPGVCHHILVHPPGGIAGGDALRLEVDVGAGAHALVTSPGAAKWYRGSGEATQDTVLRVGDGAVLEWLPQEAILYAGARCAIRNRMELLGAARLVFADVVCLGRPGSDERFDSGRWRQHGELFRDGRLLWCEETSLQGGDALLDHAAGMGGATVTGSLLWAGDPLPAALHEACLAIPVNGRAAATQLPAVWTARCLCPSVEDAWRWLRAVWALLRPVMLALAAAPPRIWAT